MKLTFSKRLLRFLDPVGEAQRMQMRHYRCIAEANAEDLVRTITTTKGQIGALVSAETDRRKAETDRRKQQVKINGVDQDH